MPLAWPFVTVARFEHSITITTPEGIRFEVPVAGIGSRFAARLIDSLIQGAALLTIFFTMAVLHASFSTGLAITLIVSVIFVVVFLYDAIFEVLLKGQTPGKRASGLRVVDVGGGPASTGAIVTRNLMRIIDFLPLYYMIGFVAMLATEHSQRVGDLVAHTLVIRERTAADREAPTRAVAARTTVPVEQVAIWDVSAVTNEEVALCYTFLARRLSLPADARHHSAVQIATRLATKVTGLPPTCHPEFVIEGVIVAKESRS